MQANTTKINFELLPSGYAAIPVRNIRWYDLEFFRTFYFLLYIPKTQELTSFEKIHIFVKPGFIIFCDFGEFIGILFLDS